MINMQSASNNKIKKSSALEPLKILIIILTLFYRWSISLNTYSGYGKPKMYGDFEAQRHWMEITYNLKLNKWYSNSTENDLNYWGLDYPPLTAYHSYLMGYVSNLINPKYVKLFESRGIETEEHKLFMRSTGNKKLIFLLNKNFLYFCFIQHQVIIFDLIIFYTSVFYCTKKLFFSVLKNSENSRNNSYFILTNIDYDYLISLFLILLNPTIVLIDHGHFQYNSISLGLMQYSIFFSLIYKPFDFNIKNITSLVLCSFFFCMSLNYKQMELYHALPIFFYLLSICFKSNIFKYGLLKLIIIGLTVLITFFLIWMPFIYNGLDIVLQVLNRLFPFSRGLFEDKVSNFWCSISVIFKLKENFSIQTLTKLSFLLTLSTNLPCCINLFMKPSRQRFMLALINSSISFFLFSFQVHEKSIILATVPACFLINSYPLIVSWFILVSNLSMLPLFYKDGLTLPYIITSLFFITIVLFYYKLNEKNRMINFWPSLKSFSIILFKITNKNLEKFLNNLFKLLYSISMLGVIFLTAGFLLIEAPKRYPDLWTVAICIYSCLHFIGFSILFNLIQFTLKNDDLAVLKLSDITRNHLDNLSFNFESTLSNFFNTKSDKNE